MSEYLKLRLAKFLAELLIGEAIVLLFVVSFFVYLAVISIEERLQRSRKKGKR